MNDSGTAGTAGTVTGTVTDPVAIAAAVKDPVGMLGGAFMISREARDFGARTGLAGMSSYFRGRFGVLGEVDADVVASAAGFFPREVVRALWEAGTAVPAAEAARGYAEACQAFGRRKLAGLPEPDAARLAELLEPVVRAADPVGAPAFGGWRAVPLPVDVHARATQLAHVLREHRGGLHIVAVLASGLTPLEAVLSGESALVPSGDGNAEFFGWPRPYPEVTEPIRERRAAAERLTDTLVAPAFSSLTGAQATELTELLGKATAVMFG